MTQLSEISEKQIEMCESSQWDFSHLRALFLNCTLKRSPEMFHSTRRGVPQSLRRAKPGG